MSKFCMGCMEKYGDQFNICPHCGYIEDTKVQEALHMEPGSILRERYIVGKVLGFGGFGVTYIGWDATLEQKVAIKEYLPIEFSTRVPGQSQVTIFNGDKAEQFRDGLSKLVEEAQHLAKFRNEDGVVRIFDSFENNNTAYIVMEYLQGETLAEYLKREKSVSPDKAIEIILPVVQALQAINAEGIIHRDIAPDNIFLSSDGKVKLIDFGAARFATTAYSRSMTVIIKPGYSPEEQYRSLGDQGSYTDVYAIGATIYRMITGEVPPDALERRAQFESKRKDILKPIGKFTDDITDNQETAILNALNIRIEDRTQDMAALAKELTTEEPETVKRLYGKVKRIDVLRWPLWTKITSAAAMLAVIITSILFATGVIGFEAGLLTDIFIPEGETRVPTVIGRDVIQAEELLVGEFLQFYIAGREYSGEVDAGMVLSQSLDAGSVVIIDSVVHITISGGAYTQAIAYVTPDIQFRDEEEAVRLIEYVGLTADVEYAVSDTVARGVVISQHPDAGTPMEPADTVSIIVSSGHPMPDLVGIEVDAAINQFLASYPTLISSVVVESIDMMDMVGAFGSFTVSFIQESHATVPQGYIISQSIAHGAAFYGEEIVLVVSTGAPTAGTGGTSFNMPNVVGMSESEARSNLTGRGLSVSVVQEGSATVAQGNVIRQSIARDTRVNRGDRVTITVSSGRNMVNVQNVVGLNRAAAISTLRAQGFEVIAEGDTSGTVTSQYPRAGSLLGAGSNVTITIAAARTPSGPSGHFDFSNDIFDAPSGNEMPWITNLQEDSWLPRGLVGRQYSHTLTATGSTPITWSWEGIQGSPLPSGLSLNSSTGVISGRPNSAGDFSFYITASNAVSNHRIRVYIAIYGA